MPRPGLIVVSGLPGTGKSSLATSLAPELGATLLVKDVIEAALWRSGVGRAERSFEISHELITSLADDALRRTAQRWEPWTDEHLTLDSLHDRYLNVSVAEEYVRAALDATSHPDP